MNISTFLTATQVAARLNVTSRTVRNWCESGHLRAERFGKSWMIDPAALVDFVPPKRGWPKGVARKGKEQADA